MDEQRDDGLKELFPYEDESRPVSQQKRRTKLIVAGGLALVLAGGLAVWGLTSFDPFGLRSLDREQAALAESWQQAQSAKVQGVDFELEVGNDALKGSPTLSFHHSGSVALVTDCFESSSSYLVLEDGSLAIEDLTDARPLEAEGCSTAKLDPLFLTSKLSFGGNDGWTAYSADGKRILGGLLEDSPDMAPTEEGSNG